MKLQIRNHHKRYKCRQASRNYKILGKHLMTREHRAGQCPTTGMPHRSPTGAKASGRTVEDCILGSSREAGSGVRWLSNIH